jgi:hypothetical protein
VSKTNTTGARVETTNAMRAALVGALAESGYVCQWGRGIRSTLEGLEARGYIAWETNAKGFRAAKLTPAGREKAEASAAVGKVESVKSYSKGTCSVFVAK